MKLVTYTAAGAEPRAGLVVDDGVIDIARASNGNLAGSLLELMQRPDWMGDLGALVGADPDHALADVTLKAPLARPGKILAAAGNYQAHVDEGGGSLVDPTHRTPRIFMKPSSAIVGPDDAVVLPAVSGEVDWELELAIIIGRTAKDVSVEDALGYVGGYTVLNDISGRSMQWGVEDREVHAWDNFFDWLVGKWCDSFSPMGPWIVTADEIADPHALPLRLTLNGELWQDADTSSMIFDCADLVSFCSRIATLEPGDVIATGTPAGVGHAKGRFLEPGDVLVGEIEGVGTLRTPAVAP